MNVIPTPSESVLQRLAETATSCVNHKPQRDNYAAPVSVEYKGRPLTTHDMPMGTSTLQGAEPAMSSPTVPWNDQVKNFVMDLVSLKGGERFKTCIVLISGGDGCPDHEDDILCLTLWCIRAKYCDGDSTMIVVQDMTDHFVSKLLTKDGFASDSRVEPVDLVRHLYQYYVEDSTYTICHDTNVMEYRDVLETLSGSAWSVYCTPQSFVESCDDDEPCKYICTVFGHQASKETRAVGRGRLTFEVTSSLDKYISRINYYSKSIRGMTCTTGRCYDCKMLYDVLVSLGQTVSSTRKPRVTLLR